MFWWIDPLYLVVLSPALLLGMWAQWRVRSAYQSAMQQPAPLTGAAAARLILDQAGLHNVPIEETPGEMSDHYDPHSDTVRLSSGVYHTRSLAAVGIAAHECGHALQHAFGYAPLVLRNIAVPAAIAGPQLSIVLLIIGAFLASSALGAAKLLIMAGFVLYAGVVVFQLINLPVEFDASNRAKRLLSELHVVDDQGAVVVRDVLNAAALTYVAATLQSILTLVYLVMRYGGVFGRRD